MAMCYLNQVKQCKTSAMFYLNYFKQNKTNVLCFSNHANKAMHFLNQHKKQSLHSVLINLSMSIKNIVLFESS